MKKQLLVIILSCILVASLSGCKAEVSNYDNLSTDKVSNFIKINQMLAYDSATGIVYLRNYGGHAAYYAPNGSPYRYNVETNTLEEIVN